MRTNAMGRRCWILGSPLWDGLLIIFPGIFILLVFFSLRLDSPLATLLLFGIVVGIDTGHVYSTVWRTLLRFDLYREEPAYWRIPLLVFSTLFFWIWLGMPYLIAFVVYATVFHHVRQYYGVIRWYERLGGGGRRLSESSFYLLMFLPFALLHFSGITQFGFFTPHDIPLYPSDVIYTSGLVLYLALLASWLRGEWRALKEERLIFAASLSAVSAFIPFVGAALYPDQMNRFFPAILAAHGIPYFALLILSLKRTGPLQKFALPALSSVVIVTAVILALLDYRFDLTYVRFDHSYDHQNAVQGALIAALLTPLLSHYLWDALIWRGKHREAGAIYAIPGD